MKNYLDFERDIKNLEESLRFREVKNLFEFVLDTNYLMENINILILLSIIHQIEMVVSILSE